MKSGYLRNYSKSLMPLTKENVIKYIKIYEKDLGNEWNNWMKKFTHLEYKR